MEQRLISFPFVWKISVATTYQIEWERRLKMNKSARWRRDASPYPTPTDTGRVEASRRVTGDDVSCRRFTLRENVEILKNWRGIRSPLHQTPKEIWDGFTEGQRFDDNELDLDFLERRQNAGHSQDKQENPQSPIEISPESVDRVKVILLGAPAVGKTSIIQQFVWNDFCEDYQPTDRKHTYYPSVITNDRLYEIKISDLPVIPYFPVNSYYEWTDYRFYGLRSATAYVLVFDLSNLETFQYVKTLREQICESRNMQNVPVLVVGNKQDLISEDGPTPGGKGVGGAEERRRDIVNLVRKHWKCGYVECSAKYNWKVVAAFKELINMIDSIEIREQSPILDNLQDALDRNKCTIL